MCTEVSMCCMRVRMIGSHPGWALVGEVGLWGDAEALILTLHRGTRRKYTPPRASANPAGSGGGRRRSSGAESQSRIQRGSTATVLPVGQVDRMGSRCATSTSRDLAAQSSLEKLRPAVLNDHGCSFVYNIIANSRRARMHY
jgi:hypothetical protein